MTVEEFLAFADTRPDGEKWELIEGIAVMSPTPTQWHQVIAGNVLHLLLIQKTHMRAAWLPMIGVGTRVPASRNSLPQPDVYVQAGEAQASAITDDALVIFEVLSKSNTKADQAWRRTVYASVPNCRHYVTIATKSAEVVRHDRSDNWKGSTVAGLRSSLALPAINAKLPLRDIYRYTPIE